MPEKLVIIYLLVINVVTFFSYGADKRKAKEHKWRTPEAMLLGLAVIGGSAGAFLGMRFFHHKTKHLKFQLGVPVILICQMLILMIFIR